MKHNISKRKLLSAILAVVLLSGAFVTSMSAQPSNNKGNKAQSSTETSSKIKWENVAGTEPITVAEKNGRKLVVEPETAQFYIEDITTQTRWYGRPSNLDSVEGMKGGEKTKVRSFLMVDVIDREVNNTVIPLTSESDSFFENGVTIQTAADSLRFVFDFPLYELTIPLRLTLTDDGISATVDLGQIKEGERYLTQAIAILPFFDAGYREEDGFVLVPDGSGAIINFDNAKGNFQKYEQTVYGYDYAISRYSYSGKEQEVRMPIFGIAHADRFSLGAIRSGAADASVNAGSNNSKNQYNYAYAEFTVRTKDALIYPNEARTDLDIYQLDTPTAHLLAIDYQLAATEAPTYVDMAESYRAYLLKNNAISDDKVKSDAVYIDLYGATVRTKPKLGIPMQQEEILTTFAQAKEILTELHEAGVPNVVVRYHKWSDATIWGKMNKSQKPASCLGGRGGLNKLRDAVAEFGYTLYLDVNPIEIHQGGLFSFFTDYAQGIRNYTAEIYPYNACTSIQDDTQKVTYLLKRDLIQQKLAAVAKDVDRLNVTGLSLSGIETIYNDFRDRGTNRDMTMIEMQAGVEAYTGSLMVQNGNIYTLKNAAHIVNAPTSSSGFDITDAGIPFYQIVLHGLISYGNEANNASPDTKAAFLRSLESGASLRFVWTAAPADVLVGSDDDDLYYANYNFWKKEALQMITQSADYYKSIVGHTITDHRKLAENVYCTVYDNGVYLVVNYSDKEVDTVYGKVGATSFLTGQQNADHATAEE